MTYVLLTMAVLIFLNLYCANINQQQFFQSKQSALVEKALLIADKVESSDVLTATTASNAAAHIGALQMTQVIVTDANGNTVYASASGRSATSATVPLLIQKALSVTDVFSATYAGGVITSAAAVPIVIGREVSGCVYMLEIDADSGRLLRTLQSNILYITIVLEIGLLAFAIFYVNRYSRRLNQIMNSMRIIQEGDYTHKVSLRGHDELSFLGKEFNFLTEQLHISESKRRQFVSDASHELKTPLASIKLLSDSILQYDMDMQTVREFAGDIGAEADRLNRMTMKLLALTKNDSNTADTDMEIIRMSPTVRRVVRMLSDIAAANNITIHLDLEHDSTVLITEDDLYQITFNLVENGIKYNVSGGTLSISLHRQEDMAVLRITDTGMGIPPEALPHIFERFYRVDKARSRQTGGSGLGLAIVKNMVERNNGEIHLQSTVGMGTIFTVSFPCFDIDENELNFIADEDDK